MTLSEQRVSHCYQWGRRDYTAGRECFVPIFLWEKTERAAYVAGYQIAAAQAARRVRLNATGDVA